MTYFSELTYQFNNYWSQLFVKLLVNKRSTTLNSSECEVRSMQCLLSSSLWYTVLLLTVYFLQHTFIQNNYNLITWGMILKFYVWMLLHVRILVTLIIHYIVLYRTRYMKGGRLEYERFGQREGIALLILSCYWLSGFIYDNTGIMMICEWWFTLLYKIIFNILPILDLS